MAKDPYRYFRVEARELLDALTQGVLRLEREAAGPDAVARLLRLAHTLKGASRVVRQPRIAELAHAVEGLLDAHRERAAPLPDAQGGELLRHLDEIAARVQELDEPAPDSARTAARTAEDEPFETVRIELKELDALHRGMAEAGVQLGGLRGSLGALERLGDLAGLLLDQLSRRPGDQGPLPERAAARARGTAEELRQSLALVRGGLGAGVDRLEGDVAHVLEVSHRLRLVPAHTVFPALDRAARDAAQGLGRRVQLETSGGEVRLDAQVLAALRDALLHVVRNAVAHGIEPEAERVAAGKPPAGRITLEVERRGSGVVFRCRDDGRGIDVEAVRRAAVDRARVSEPDAAALLPDQVLRLLLAGGLTTSGAVTELAGRGIGLDVVRETAARLKGDVRLQSERGRGATVELRAPLSVASLPALVVDAGGALAALPLDAVRRTLRLRDQEVARSPTGDSILDEGRILPFLPLERALQRARPHERRARPWSAVVVHAGGRAAAIGVDRLLGTASLVMRPLPAAVDADPVVAGACLDAEGNPQLVLDPAGLVAAAERGHGDAAPDRAPPPRPPLLLIDDSLTTRMLEQSILESAGYEVELAVSAEEALAKAQLRRFALFVVDVEMPGMDGFSFVAHARADPALRDVPSILVTSRGSPEDRRRGEQAGARGYIVKGEFDQDELLRSIRALIG